MLFPVAVNLLMGCCNCLETVFFDYSNCAVSVDNLDNSQQEAVISSTNSIPKEAFGLKVNIERKEGICYNSFKPFLMSSAYATSCNCPPEQLYQPLDSIVSIQIKSLMDFDLNHLSDDYITEYFSVLSSTEYTPIEEFIAGRRGSISDLDYFDRSFNLMLMTAPVESSEYQFEVEVELSDGRVLREISESVELL